ncbi:MAG: hypothetical protein V4637_10895 [Pseudomonadota bacterium]
MVSWLRHGEERPVAHVPRAVKVVLVLALCTHVMWQAVTPKPSALAAALSSPPATSWLRVASLGEPIALSQWLVLYLQAFDNQPGLSIPYAELDYQAVQHWLAAALSLDPHGQYPLLMATHLYAQVADEHRKRQMLEFVHSQFLVDPDRRWRWLALAAITAKHQLRDLPLALTYSESITRSAPAAGSWARQMRIFLLADLGEHEAAAVMLGALLASGEVTDAAETHFLMSRLEALKVNDKLSIPAKFP